MNLFPSKADAKKCVPRLQRSDDIPAGDYLHQNIPAGNNLHQKLQNYIFFVQTTWRYQELANS